MSTDILDELDWRGLIAQSTDRDALRRDLAGPEPLTLYCGFDPTAPSLHAGNLVPLLTLRRFQEAGARPIVLAGGATGMIGDPREVGERSLNSAETVGEWAGRIRGQLERFVTFDGPTGALVVDNLEWTGTQSVLEFLRDTGKHFSVNVMLGRETVRRRLAAEGMSYTEFSYLLLQSQDYLHLHRRHGCRLQIGGSDQWGNIVGGVELIRRVAGATAHALTVPLVTDSEGRKFGKSTGGGNIWLDPQLTSPYAWYQYFVNVADADVGRYLRLFTFLPHDEIEALERDVAERPQLRAGARRLAEELTTLVHGGHHTDQVRMASAALFGRGDLRELDAGTLDAALAEVPGTTVDLEDKPTIVDLLVATGLSESRGAARRTVGEGGAYVNNAKVTDQGWTPEPAELLHGRWLVVRRGKRNLAGVRVGTAG